MKHWNRAPTVSKDFLSLPDFLQTGDVSIPGGCSCCSSRRGVVVKLLSAPCQESWQGSHQTAAFSRDHCGDTVWCVRCHVDLHQQGGMSQLSHPSDKKTIPVVASSAELHMRTDSLIKVSAPDSITSSLATLCSFSAPGLIIPVSLYPCVDSRY